MVVVVAKVVDKEINKALVKEVKEVEEFNEGLVKFYLCKEKQIKFDVLVVNKVLEEDNKVVEEVNKKLVKEYNDFFEI